MSGQVLFRAHFLDGKKVDAVAVNATEAGKLARASYIRAFGGDVAPPITKLKVVKETTTA